MPHDTGMYSNILFSQSHEIDFCEKLCDFLIAPAQSDLNDGQPVRA